MKRHVFFAVSLLFIIAFGFNLADDVTTTTESGVKEKVEHGLFREIPKLTCEEGFKLNRRGTCVRLARGEANLVALFYLWFKIYLVLGVYELYV